MGSCVGCSNDKYRDPLDIIDQQPPDTKDLENIKLPVLSFHGLLSNIKVKKCSYPALSMKFQIQSIQQFDLIEKYINPDCSAKWKISHPFEIHLTEYEMRKKFLIITFKGGNKSIVGFLKINLYLLAIGPYHQDFAITLSNDKNARFSFDMKLSQLIEIKLESLQTQIIPNQREYSGDKFFYCFRPISGNKPSFIEYLNSYTVVIDFDESQIAKMQNKQQKQQMKMSTMPQKRKLRQLKSVIEKQLAPGEKLVNGNNISWSHKISDNMPILEGKIPLYQMHSSCLHVIFWKLDDENISKQEKSTQESINKMNNRHSQCYISINKLLQHEVQEYVDQKTGIKYEIRTMDLVENNRNQQKQVGKSKFKLKFRIQTHLKQMQVCVRTQNGILQSSPVFSNEKSHCVEIQQITKLNEEIQNSFLELGKKQSQKVSQFTIKKQIEKIRQLFLEQVKILKKSSKQSIICYKYTDEKQLLKGQKVFIDLAFKSLNYIEQDHDQLVQICWNLLICIMKRGQFSLAYLGYNKEEKKQIEKDDISSFLKKKLAVGFKYQSLLSKLLAATFKSFSVKNHQNQKRFAEIFWAYAYFAIPAFRTKILQLITRSDDPQIVEWRGTQFNLYEPINFQKKQNDDVFELFFNWENNFYKILEKEEKYQKNSEELSNILQENAWEEGMAKRGGAFFSLIKFWVGYIQQVTVSTKNLLWKYFPGYNKILHSFLVQFKRRQIYDYPQSLIQAMLALLSNGMLINTFVTILFRKTNVHDQMAIHKVLQLLDQFFIKIKENGQTISSSFDYKYFIKGIKIILESDYSYTISRCMVLLYNHFKIFSIEFQIQLSFYLLGKLFFRFFLHWSCNVRASFHHLLFIRIYHSANIANSQKNDDISLRYSSEIKPRYEKLFVILQNSKRKKEEESRKGLVIQREKDLYKVLKRKLFQKKKRKKSLQSDGEYQFFSMQDLENSVARSKSSSKKDKMIEELSKPQLQRYNSVVMTGQLKVAVQESKKKQAKDQIIILKTSKNFLKEEKIMNIHSQKKPTKRLFLFSEEQMTITLMTKVQLEYIEESLSQYQKVCEMFIAYVKKNKDSSVPVVKFDMPIDQGQIRPDRLSEQW